MEKMITQGRKGALRVIDQEENLTGYGCLQDILEAIGCSSSQLLRKREQRDDWRKLVHSASNNSIQ